MNKKPIQRNTRLEIRMSDEEKELFFKFAEDMGINPSRLARNILMQEAESIINKYSLKPFVKAYIKYLQLTKQEEILERIKED